MPRSLEQLLREHNREQQRRMWRRWRRSSWFNTWGPTILGGALILLLSAVCTYTLVKIGPFFD
jgi:hypothetical protein